MRIFNNLRLLQVFDSALLMAVLGIIALLLWVSLTDVSVKTQQNLQESTASLQVAHDSFQRQVALETLIDQQRKAFNTLDETFFQFTLSPNSDTKNLLTIKRLVEELHQQQPAVDSQDTNKRDRHLMEGI